MLAECLCGEWVLSQQWFAEADLSDAAVKEMFEAVVSGVSRRDVNRQVWYVNRAVLSTEVNHEIAREVKRAWAKEHGDG